MNPGTKIFIAVLLAAIILVGTVGYLWNGGAGDDDGDSGDGDDSPDDGGPDTGNETPPDPVEIRGYDAVSSYLDLSDEQETYLAEHEFAFITDAPTRPTMTCTGGRYRC